MILGAGMEPQAPGAAAPHLVDGPLEKIPPQALPDVFWHQPELHQFNVTFDPPVQLSKASRDTLGHQNVDFEPGVVEQGSQFGVGELLAAGPVVIPPYIVVQEPIV